MIFLLLLALALSNSSSDLLLKKTSEVASGFQHKCVQILPTETTNRETLASLLCGENITDKNLKENLVKTSLIHIFVISGSHLILLDELLSILKIPFFLRFLFLSFYSLVVGWQPPAVRALITLAVRGFFHKMQWRFPADLIVLIAGLITLVLFPTWWNSLSLLMSWCASLALCWLSVLKIRSKILALLATQVAIFLFMSAPLWGLGNLHPLSLLYNILLGPVVAYLLLPLAFISSALHALLPLFDKTMELFNFILDHFSEPIVLNKTAAVPIATLWCWILFWHFFFHGLRLRLYQGRDYSR